MALTLDLTVSSLLYMAAFYGLLRDHIPSFVYWLYQTSSKTFFSEKTVIGINLTFPNKE